MDLQAEYDGQPTEHSPLTRDKSIEESNHIEMVFASKKTGSNEECRGQLEIEKETSSAADQDAIENEKQTNNDKRCKKCHIPKCLSPCLPPRGFFGDVLTRGLICFLAWATLWAILGKEALPGGNMYSLFILLVTASFAGFLVSTIPYVTFPPLLGMLIAGFLLRNVPGISVAKNINKQWSANLRNVALVVILLRSGLGLDIEALKRLKCTVIRLAFSPCLVEAITVGIVSHFLLGMPWLWAFMLG